jgi:hypothetical protein
MILFIGSLHESPDYGRHLEIPGQELCLDAAQYVRAMERMIFECW